MTEPRILITGTGGPSGISILKDLEGQGYDLYSGDIDPYATGLYLVDEDHRMLLPRGDDPKFSDRILAIWQGDDAYPDGDPERPGRRHRLSMQGGDWRYERTAP